MYKGKKIVAIVAAAGTGTRMKTSTPKQFLEIEGVPILAKTLKAFQQNEFIDEIVLVINLEFEVYVKVNILREFGLTKVKQIVMGGKERQDSIWNALQTLKDDVEIVLVHDGARPFVSQEVIENLISKTFECNAAVTAVPSKDTVKFLNKGVFTKTPDRKKVYSVQTPQGFRRTLLVRAYEKAEKDGFYGTDDAVLVERLGEKVYFSMGEYQNYKITTLEDLPKESTKSLVNQNNLQLPRIGVGYDVHKLVFGRELIIGGVKIPFEKGLLGHSDADVLLHALMDAMLGAAALGDIGKHFPDTEEKYKGISSLKLLEKTNELIKNAGFEMGNTDMTLIAERPKIACYIEEMKKNISMILQIEENCINIKGTTTEKLGFCGRGEGISAEAAVLLFKK